jgi:hypothetical protein
VRKPLGFPIKRQSMTEMIKGRQSLYTRVTDQARESARMKRLILGSVVVLLLTGGPAIADCLYQGVTYSEGARVCIYRTMLMCRGKRWVRTAERCWERYFNQTSPLPHAGQKSLGVLAEIEMNVTPCDAVAVGAVLNMNLEQ